ncbi:Cupin, RmlC-type [Cordyceps militaris]|uniref:Cupin, RmlC-type n=1 Tax=Cordyceps militaris TaxID=73501 RepID=A0A2H4ST35_CORMI|nr:Cupin, RmlC-type [Cordyceps militaris]
MSTNDIPSVVTRPLPNAVTYDLTVRDRVTITLPPHSAWSSGLHWHEDHDEYLAVVQGRIHVKLGDEECIVNAGQPEVHIPRHAWHSWRRAEADGNDVVVVERTDPADLQKAVFFWNLNGVVLDAPALDAKMTRLPSWLRGLLVDWWVTMSLFVIFHHLDNWPVLVNVPEILRPLVPGFGQSMVSQVSQKVDWLCTHTTLGLATLVGRLFGVAPVQRRYTPASIFAQWGDGQDKNKKIS